MNPRPTPAEPNAYEQGARSRLSSRTRCMSMATRPGIRRACPRLRLLSGTDRRGAPQPLAKLRPATDGTVGFKTQSATARAGGACRRLLVASRKGHRLDDSMTWVAEEDENRQNSRRVRDVGTGQEMLRVAQHECAGNGLGSTYLVAYEGAVFEPVMVGSGRNRRGELRLVGHRETGPEKSQVGGRRTRRHRTRGRA